jgi:ubiquinone/menaquinone biosynthesis C-methylase UbiE
MLDWLTPVYDAFVRLFLREARVKQALIAYARLAAGDHVLDLGCGTGTLAIRIKQMRPGTRIRGIDADAAVLALAQRKAAHAAAEIAFDLGSVTALPYADASFDCVVSSLVFSLLSREDKQRALRESYRVLRAGGTLQLLDFGPLHTRWGRLLARRMRRFAPIVDHLDGRLPALMRQAGFTNVNAETQFATLLGTLVLLHGRQPG